MVNHRVVVALWKVSPSIHGYGGMSVESQSSPQIEWE